MTKMCQTAAPEHTDDEGFESGSDNSEPEPDDEVIRAKWIFDGAKTLDEVIEKLYSEIEHIKKLKEEGWELSGEVQDDYGFIRKRIQ